MSERSFRHWRGAVAIAAAFVIGIAGLAASAGAQSTDHGMPGMDHMGSPAATQAAVPTADPNQVIIKNFAFNPPTLTVPRGTTVTWINKDGDAHTVSAAGTKPLFKSPPLDTGDMFSFVFKDPGTYAYFCSVHPFMKGTVVVR
jgi:plastocyanin